MLPVWARIGMLALIACVILGAGTLLAHGAWMRDAEQASSAVGLLTVSLPVLLIVIALVFGQNSDERLRKLTRLVLEQDIPNAMRDNFGAAAGEVSVTSTLRGCAADYLIRLPACHGRLSEQRFTVELNVHKVNVCCWVERHSLPERVNADSPEIRELRHVLLGALAEGYRLNEEPAKSAEHGAGLVLYRVFPEDFLLHPGRRLYFVQDLSFFVRGVLEARHMPQRAGAGA